MIDEESILDPSAREAALRPLVERFGIERQAFDGYTLRQSGRKYVTISVGPELSPGLRVASRGIPFLRVNLAHPKPTTGAILLFGRRATRNIVSLTLEEARRFLRREDLEVAPELPDVTDFGYVIVRWGRVTLGLAVLLPDGRLKSLYPGRWSPAPQRADDATPAGI